MHRSILALRAIITGMVLAWLLSSSLAHAQAPGVKSIVIQIGTTQTIETASKLPVREIKESNPKIARAVPGPMPSVVLITGLFPGNSRVDITDVKNNVEVFDVIVASDDRRVLEAARKAFLQTVKQVAPTANIDAVPAANNVIVLTGTVSLAADIPPIIDVAKGHFGQASTIVNHMKLGGVQMVQLDVIIARVNRSEVRNLTFNFMYRNVDFFVGSVLKSPLAAAGSAAPAIGAATSALSITGLGNVPFGVLKGTNGITGFLEALRTEGLAKIYSQPSVMATSGKPSYIVSGGETPILTSSGQGSPSVSYKQFGTVVSFLPIIQGDGKIYLEVQPELSQLDAASGLFIAGVTPTAVPGFATRSVKSAATLEDGQTLAIGGLIQSTQDTTLNKIPILGDLPYLGTFFRTHNSREVEEELIILVTPRLIHPMDCTQLPKYLPGRETRTPDDFELFLEGILEAPRGPREVGLFGTGAHMFDGSPYPCGDSCDGRGGRGGRCTLPGCKRCQSVIHTAVPSAPLNTAGNGRVMSRRIQPVLAEESPRPAFQAAETNPAAFAVPEIRELPPVVTPVVTPVTTPVTTPVAPVTPAMPAPVRESPGWQPPPVNTPLPMVPPVSELRRDLN